MHNESAAEVHHDATDTLRPPAPEYVPPLRVSKRPKERRQRGYTVTVRCEDEKQQAMLVDWLMEKGFDVEGITP